MRTARYVTAVVIGAVLLALARVVGGAQTVLRMQRRGRRLTEPERSMLSEIFGAALSLDPIRIVEGFAGVLSVNGRAATLGNTIYLKGCGGRDDVLVHEATHVWQCQRFGPRYAAEALAAQLFVRDAYEWRGRGPWERLNREAQAQYVQDERIFPAKAVAGGWEGGNVRQR